MADQAALALLAGVGNVRKIARAMQHTKQELPQNITEGLGKIMHLTWQLRDQAEAQLGIPLPEKAKRGNCATRPKSSSESSCRPETHAQLDKLDEQRFGVVVVESVEEEKEKQIRPSKAPRRS